MESLPIELVSDIIEKAQYRDHLPFYKDLRSWCLVCRTWRAISQPLLFRRVVVRGGGRQCTKLLRSLQGDFSMEESNHSESLRNAVRTLVVAIDHQMVYIDVILLCPNLRELIARLHHAFFRPDAIGRLCNASTNITALHVRSVHSVPMYQLFEALQKSILYLSIDSRSTRFSSFADFTPTWSLRELRIDCLPSHSKDLLGWILSGPNAIDTLDILDASMCSPRDFRLHAFEFTHLRSLRVHEITTTDFVFDRTPRKPMAQLQELIFSAIARDASESPSEFFDNLPLSIHHLGFSDLVSDDSQMKVIEGLARFQDRCSVEGGYTLGLKAFTFTSKNQSAKLVKDIIGFQDFCHHQDIDFVLMDPVYGTLSGEFEPLGNIPTIFPRWKPLSSHRKSPEYLMQGDFKSSRRFTRKIMNKIKFSTSSKRKADSDSGSISPSSSVHNSQRS
ncbi:hypothetical protein C8Q75DRAFT_758783 [Abortiporus biennis]|nr:hypothetical protein C8Q75DRAFT_758783 [Abortiporus biennis]